MVIVMEREIVTHSVGRREALHVRVDIVDFTSNIRFGRKLIQIMSTNTSCCLCRIFDFLIFKLFNLINLFENHFVSFGFNYINNDNNTIKMNHQEASDSNRDLLHLTSKLCATFLSPDAGKYFV